MATPILDKLAFDIKEAMKAKDSEKLITLRSMQAEIKNLAIEKRPATKDANDEDALTVIAKGIKQRVDARDQFIAANRPELAETEIKQIAIWQAYLPAQMSREEIEATVDRVITETGATTKKDVGVVMKALMPLVKGKADGSLVSKVVGEKLP